MFDLILVVYFGVACWCYRNNRALGANGTSPQARLMPEERNLLMSFVWPITVLRGKWRDVFLPRMAKDRSGE